MVEVAELNLAYAQRFCDYHHSIHVGSQPISAYRFDPDNATDLGLSVNTAVLLPPDGNAMYVEPTSDAYDSQLKCLQTLEEQIRSLASVLAKQNVTNAAAEAKRLDRIDSDSIMALVSEDLARTVQDMPRIAGKYAGVEPPTVSIPQDFTNRLLDGNQITAMLQLQMQNQISQETLLRILQEGEVIPPYVEIDEEIALTKEAVQEDFDLQLEQAEAMGSLESAQAEAGGVNTCFKGCPDRLALPTLMRPNTVTESEKQEQFMLLLLQLATRRERQIIQDNRQSFLSTMRDLRRLVQRMSPMEISQLNGDGYNAKHPMINDFVAD